MNKESKLTYCRSVVEKRDITSFSELEHCDWSIFQRCRPAVTTHAALWKLLERQASARKLILEDSAEEET